MRHCECLETQYTKLQERKGEFSVCQLAQATIFTIVPPGLFFLKDTNKAGRQLNYLVAHVYFVFLPCVIPTNLRNSDTKWFPFKCPPSPEFAENYGGLRTQTGTSSTIFFIVFFFKRYKRSFLSPNYKYKNKINLQERLGKTNYFYCTATS